MISVRADTHNRQVLVTIDNAPHKVRRGLVKALTEIGKENVRHTQNLIKAPPKTGRIYRRKGRVHRASAPFEPPAEDRGKLRRGVKYRVYGWEKMEYGDTVSYGKYLEEGTKRKTGRVKMKPRPHLKTTVREKQKDNFVTLERTVYNKLNRL